MVKHCSVFTLRDKAEIPAFLRLLEEVSRQCPTVCDYEIGAGLAQEDGHGPDFGDVVQILTFASLDDARDYPNTAEHQRLLGEGPAMAKVTAIDWLCA